jgi:predicted Fe-Mo cluster-binding NifX family protein
MMANLVDCQVLLCAGMGMGAHASLQAIGVTPILTDCKDIQQAVQAYLDGTLADHRERLH